MNNPVIVVSVGAGYSYGSLGYSHHAIEDLAIMRSLPNLDVISPCDKFEAEVVTRMIARTSKPSYLRLGKAGEPELHKTLPSMQYGRFVRLASGSGGYLFFTGSVGSIAMQAQALLCQSKKFIEVLSVPFVSQLDEEYLLGMNPSLPIVVLEEHSRRGGLGAAFFEKFNELGISASVTHIAASQKEISLTGSQDYLRSQNGITLEAILSAF